VVNSSPTPDLPPTITPIVNLTPAPTFTPAPTESPAPPGQTIPTVTLTPANTSTLVPSLTSTTGPSIQLLTNNSFENGSTFPDGWAYQDIDGGDIRDCSVAYVGSCSFRFVGSGHNETIRQELAFEGGPDEVLTLTWYTRILGTPDCATRLIAYYGDGSTEAQQSNYGSTGGNWTGMSIGLTTDQPYVRVDVEFSCTGATSVPPPSATGTPLPSATGTPTPSVTGVWAWFDLVELRGRVQRSGNPTATP
jgi:hypothetical protein